MGKQMTVNEPGIFMREYEGLFGAHISERLVKCLE
jgi:hypothetical protein